MVMQSLHQALDRDAILRALSSFYGITTADGNVGGTTLICSILIGANDFISTKTILLQSGNSIYEHRNATAFNPLTGQITVNPAFSSQVLAGTSFYVLNTVAVDIAPLLANQGLCYYGVVTGVPGANQFTIATLAGLGANKFIDLSGVAPYYAFVFRVAAGGGAPPQNEYQPITNYATLTGNFTANAFTVPVGIGDEILIIHPFLARIMNFYGLPPATGSIAQNWQAAEADVVSFGAANTKYKCHLAAVSMHNLVGNVIRIRAYRQVVGVERKFYDQVFDMAAGTDVVAADVINGTVGIHEVVRITLLSNNAADNAKAVDYEYMLERM